VPIEALVERRKAAKRELIDTEKDKRFVRRGAKAQLKESDHVGRSLKRDRQQKAKQKVKSGQETGGAPLNLHSVPTKNAVRIVTIEVVRRSE
jgi:hypothetical protein